MIEDGCEVAGSIWIKTIRAAAAIAPHRARPRMELLQLIIASAAYAVGGLFMKFSDGLSRPLPVIAFSLLFLAGAQLQALGMRRADLGVAYIFVLGLEALLAALFSIGLLRESWSATRVAAVALILAGIVLLRRT